MRDRIIHPHVAKFCSTVHRTRSNKKKSTSYYIFTGGSRRAIELNWIEILSSTFPLGFLLCRNNTRTNTSFVSFLCFVFCISYFVGIIIRSMDRMMVQTPISKHQTPNTRELGFSILICLIFISKLEARSSPFPNFGLPCCSIIWPSLPQKLMCVCVQFNINILYTCEWICISYHTFDLVQAPNSKLQIPNIFHT